MINKSVVHITTSDKSGGAARSAWRIHQGLFHKGWNSRMLVGFKKSKDKYVKTYARNRVFQWMDYKISRFQDVTGWQYCGLPFSRLWPLQTWIQKTEILQLYNLHGGFFDLQALIKIARGRHIILRLSDLWPITGHCAYPKSCDRWLNGCGACPDLSAFPPVKKDRTKELWRRKYEIYKKIKSLTIIAPSSFTEDSARLSPLLNGRRILRIPNGVDTNKYRPMDQKTARHRLGIDDQSSVGIVFISHVAFANMRKGTDFLMEALKQVNQEALFLVLGENSQAWAGRCPQRTFTFPFTKDPSVLRDVINAGDIMVQPSVLENLPNTLLEGMSCGKPAVVFDRGGMRDAVESNVQGFCLKEASANTLSEAINYLIADEKARKQMGKAARAKMLQSFNLQKEIDEYEKLYFSLLNKNDF